MKSRNSETNSLAESKAESIQRLSQGVAAKAALAESVGRPPVAFSTLMISPNLDRGAVLRSVVANTKRLLLLKNPEGYPSGHELIRLLNSTQPEVVILDLIEPEDARRCAEQILGIMPEVAIIGVGSATVAEGLTAVLPYPPSMEDLTMAAELCVRETRGFREKNLLAFLPAKAGSGASTIALNTAGALAAIGRKVLLVDADLRSGSLALMLDLLSESGLQSVLRGAAELDRFLLDKYITRAHGMDLLLSTGSSDGLQAQWDEYFRLLEVARSAYDFIVVDLPELVNPASREIVRRAQAVFNVCTQEIVPLKLAERRCRELEEADVPADRVHLLVNRFSNSALKVQDMERFVKRGILHVFPNDYATVRGAILKGELVPSGSPLGSAYFDFARQLAGVPAPETSAPSRFGSLFSFR